MHLELHWNWRSPGNDGRSTEIADAHDERQYGFDEWRADETEDGVRSPDKDSLRCVARVSPLTHFQDEDPVRIARAQWARLAATLFVPPAERGILVPSNRHFWRATSASDGTYTIDEPQNWTNLLHDKERHPEPIEQAVFRKFQETFSSLSGGLGFRITGKGAGLVPSIVDGESAARPMEECGDGLRELAAIILHVLLCPYDDLFIEEPGTRLHPGAQRKMVAFLAENSSDRAIWYTSHDPAFVSSHLNGTRWSVQRENGVTSVIQVETLAATSRVIAQQLGWEPADACLKGTFLYCEGPSDKAAYAAIVEHLSGVDGDFAGVAVEHFEGCSVAESKNLAELKRVLKIAKAAAPHSKHVFILDRDEKTEKQIRLLESALKEVGVGAHILPNPDLEAAWMEAECLEHLVQEEARKLECPKEAAAKIQKFLDDQADRAKPCGKQLQAFFADELESYTYAKPTMAARAVAWARANAADIESPAKRILDTLCNDVRAACSKAI